MGLLLKLSFRLTEGQFKCMITVALFTHWKPKVMVKLAALQAAVISWLVSQVGMNTQGSSRELK